MSPPDPRPANSSESQAYGLRLPTWLIGRRSAVKPAYWTMGRVIATAWLAAMAIGVTAAILGPILQLLALQVMLSGLSGR